MRIAAKSASLANSGAASMRAPLEALCSFLPKTVGHESPEQKLCKKSLRTEAEARSQTHLMPLGNQ